MQRRSVLRRAAALGAAERVGSTAGCLTERFESGPTNVVLVDSAAVVERADRGESLDTERVDDLETVADAAA